MINSTFFELEKALSNLYNQECWAITAGKGSGSMVSIDFGGKNLRDAPINNPYISLDAQHYIGEYSLFIEHCAWRLDNTTEIICGSTDDNANDGIMVNGLKSLIGQKVHTVHLSFPSYDLIIKFQNQYNLHLFCDQLNLNDALDNYSFSTSEITYVIGTRSKLSCERSS